MDLMEMEMETETEIQIIERGLTAPPSPRLSRKKRGKIEDLARANVQVDMFWSVCMYDFREKKTMMMMMMQANKQIRKATH